MRNPYPNFTWFVGVAEDLKDPSQLGRVRVRAIGFHPSIEVLDTTQLPWAGVLNGGTAKIKVGQMVMGFFMDGEEGQQPFILGTINGGASNISFFDYISRLKNRGPRNKTQPNGDPIPPEDLPSLGLGGEKNQQAKQLAEQFLGKPISDAEWELLLRATVAEASQNSKERAAVMAVILNRVRANYGGENTITGVLYADYQFQSVTGPPPGGSINFLEPTENQIAGVTNSVLKHLQESNSSWLNFTSNNEKAYGPGTNIGFLYRARKNPNSKIIGQTIFFTDQ